MAGKLSGRSQHWWVLILVVSTLLVGLIIPSVVHGCQAVDDLDDVKIIHYLKLCHVIREQYRDECGWLWPAPTPAQPDPGPTVTELNATGYVKGLYITRNGLGSKKLRDHAKALLETTELNAIVMDVKGDRGFLVYPSQVKLAHEIGSDKRVMIQDWGTFMRWFTDHKVYTIARIVVFKDELLAVAHPEWAVKDSETGDLWRDGEGLGWGDPTREEVWDYNIALAVEAAQKGFDEIQFDYVRFPTDGQISRATFAKENTQEHRIQAITGFLSKARDALKPYHVKLAVDTFGYTTWRTDDMGIGQQLEALAPYLDVFSPMLYPSTFADGLPGTSDYNPAIAHPYDIVYLSTQRAVARMKAANPAIEVRPWLQDFPDYAFDGRTYTPDEIRRQMAGAREAGGRGWMLWDPRVKYTPAALVSATPSYPPNLDGRLLVLEYHHIGEPEKRWQRTPDNFRADLERLLGQGYYPVDLRDLVEGRLSMVPAGKRPVVLTFDDSTIGQFRILPDGSIDPDSAVGILKAFHAAHPADWPMRATFFVLQGVGEPGYALFGQPDLARHKLALLVKWGMEVGSHTISHARLSDISPEKVQWELGLSQAQLEGWLPGYEVVSLAVPDGLYPQDEALLAAGEQDGQVYTYKAAVEVGGGLTTSPRSSQFDPYHILRVRATGSLLDYWLQVADQPGVYYVSAGE